MLRFNLKGKTIKFVKYSLNNRTFYDNESKDAYAERLDNRNIPYTVTEYDQPSEELLQAVEGKKFNTIAEAREFIQAVQDGIVPKTTEERINDLELLVLQLGGIIE